MSPPGNFSRAPILCYVTDRKSPFSADQDQSEAVLKSIVSAAAAGVDWIQVREKDLPVKTLSSLIRGAIAETKHLSERNRPVARILVNDRLDVAVSECAAGVHLGEHSMPVREVRKWLSANPQIAADGNFLLGVSCHSVQAAINAERDGADYIFFGPVFATPSKAAFGPPQGLQRLTEVCSTAAIPVIAIGGIILENASDCFLAGAAGIAAIRLFQGAENLTSVVQELRRRGTAR